MKVDPTFIDFALGPAAYEPPSAEAALIDQS